MRIHIKSDGTARGTSVLDLETGRPIPLLKLSFSAGPTGTTAVLHVPIHSFDITTEATIAEPESAGARPAGDSA